MAGFGTGQRVNATIPDLQGRVVLITGASTGIGAAAARAFGRNGAQVAISFGASTTAAEEVAAEIRASGSNALLVLGDVIRAEEAAQVVGDTIRHFGRLDALINNAGALVRRTAVADNGDEFVGTALDINVRQVVRFVQAAAIQMRAQGSCGAIINLSSIAAVTAAGPAR